ncbi:NAD(P)-dependent oxidoreductase [Modestobacter sp. DSM 44400]|uniref:NAD(P)-dependent oxidoreductase n=1 Tax=Modestobacter sp. DSM 44400 TaxID=1550230 RepID=UPI0020C92AC7|nr:NAD(P)-dependent oxidoreductase [Modestobacter sp. DSM 44400]
MAEQSKVSGVPTPVSVVVLDDWQDVALSVADWSPLSGRAHVVRHTDHLADADALVDRLSGAEVVLAMRERTPFPAEVLARLPRLRLLVTTGMANAAIDVAAAAAQGVVVSGTAGGSAAAAELAWALVLAVARDVPGGDRAVRAGRWQEHLGIELAGSTLGLLGLGRIGAVMARYARAFDMRVLAWSENLTAGRAAEHGAELVGRADLFERSDVVSVHLRLSERTRGLVGAEELALLGPEGRLVNTSRGPIVDEAALLAALDAGTIAGAALDVFDIEPLPVDAPLRRAPRTVLTPHLGYVSRQSYAAMYGQCVEDVLAWLDGAPVRVLGNG